MSRNFEAITKKELADKIKSTYQKVSNGDRYLSSIAGYMINLTPEIAKDLSKVLFADENFFFDSGCAPTIENLVTLDNGLTFFGCYVHGDWEAPVFFIIYWDGKKLRAYIPKDGNTYNKKTNRAYGNDDSLDFDDEEKLYGEVEDPEKILNDIRKRILYKSGDVTAVVNDAVINSILMTDEMLMGGSPAHDVISEDDHCSCNNECKECSLPEENKEPTQELAIESDPEFAALNEKPIDFKPFLNKNFIVGVNKGDRNGTSFLCSTLRGPYTFTEMIEQIGTIWEETFIHAKAMSIEKDREANPLIVNEYMADYIEANYKEILVNAILATEEEEETKNDKE